MMAKKDGRHDPRSPRGRRQRNSPKPSVGKPQFLWTDLTHKDKLDVVCRLFCKAKNADAIAAQIHEDYAGERFNRQSVYPMLLEAVRDGRLRFVPRPDSLVSIGLRDRYKWLKDVKVVHTNEFEDVAYQGAETLIGLLQEVKLKKKKRKVHVGFAGGHAVRRLAQIFAQSLDESDASLPKTLVLHALVAGFDVLEPTTDPNTFFTLFQNHTSVNTKFEFVGLHTPPVVKASEYDVLKNAEGIRESYEHARDLDIIVTSAADWSDRHSTFRKYMEKSANCSEVLVNAGCVGDMLWLPVGPRGPLDAQTRIRSMTLVELSELPAFLKSGKHVLLVLGPCAMCQNTKSRILSGILASEQRLISHLVVDTRSAKEVMR
ncbi:MAG: hypothetical protein JW993_02525 [Sedimentisphaerales bacterium]|nr:hypothetical protein [Sedimentisphaerales bacterium]